MSINPKVSLILFCYNQEEFIKESLTSCLSQDYQNLEIVISDDASSDNTVSIIKKTLESYNGPRKILLNENKKNLGIGKHFSYIMDNLVNGELVVICAGDDISEPNRTSRIVQEYTANNKPSLIAHNLVEINETGKEIIDFRTIQYALQKNDQINNNTYSILEYLKFHQPIPFIGAAIAYKLSTYKKFSTPSTLPDYEDHLMYFRALLDNGVHYFNEKLVRYRKHSNNYTSQETKAFDPQTDQILSYYFDKRNNIKNEYRNCYQTHKVAVQQWLDYKKSIKKFNTQVNYQLIENLWGNIYLRHRYLIQNKALKHKLKAKLSRYQIIQKIIKPDPIKYLDSFTTVIFGTSQAAKNLINTTGGGFNIIAACNSIDPEARGKKLQNIPIINLEDLKNISDKIDCVLIASNKYYQIKAMLLTETKIKENTIVRIPALSLAAPLQTR